MQKLALKIFALILPFASPHVLVDILRHKNIFQAVIFDCSTILENQVSNLQTINHYGVKISYKKIFPNKTDTYIPCNFYKLGIAIDSSCEGWVTIFQNLDHAAIFRSPYFWFIFTEDLSGTFDTLSQFPIEVNSDVTVLNRNGFKYDIHEVYNTGYYTKGHFFTQRLGYWENSKLVIRETKRMNFSGVVLKCMVVITKNVAGETIEQYVEGSRHTGFDTLHKLKYFTMLKYLRDMYKFR